MRLVAEVGTLLLVNRWLAFMHPHPTQRQRTLAHLKRNVLASSALYTYLDCPSRRKIPDHRNSMEEEGQNDAAKSDLADVARKIPLEESRALVRFSAHSLRSLSRTVP
jgi:hypothetical protein